jgi:UDP-glucuronate 4-epimerase
MTGAKGHNMPTALVTGSAGFIGFHLYQRLLADGWNVTGFDGLTDYYDVALKKRRHQILREQSNFSEVIDRLEDDAALKQLVSDLRPDVVVHLAAQAGVRYSIDHPRSYVDSNLIGTFNVIEAVRATPVKHLLIASTSSVYGANTDMPYCETHKADAQMSFYAATKKACEAMAHSYAHLYDIPTTMFRFFTVYGAWGRPDMAHFKFTRAILRGQPIDVYNHGEVKRDFTYIDDLIGALTQLIDAVPASPANRKATPYYDSLSPVAPHRIVNIGSSSPVQLLDYISEIEKAVGKKARMNFLDMQPGDVPATWADTRLLDDLISELPTTRLSDGIAQFVAWYREYYDE